jgi:hypothetical protein
MTTHEIGAVPDRWNITHLSGQRFEVTIPVLDGAASPVVLADLTSGRVHVRPSVDSDQILHEFNTEADPANAVLDEVAGSAVLIISATSAETTEWVTLWPGNAGQAVVWWDVEVTDTTGEPHQLMRPGTITLVHEVTR